MGPYFTRTIFLHIPLKLQIATSTSEAAVGFSFTFDSYNSCTAPSGDLGPGNANRSDVKTSHSCADRLGFITSLHTVLFGLPLNKYQLRAGDYTSQLIFFKPSSLSWVSPPPISATVVP